MRIRGPIMLAACLFLVSCATHSERLANKTTPIEIEFEQHFGAIFIPVIINQVEGLFMVDTGSAVTTLNRSWEPQLGKRLGTLKERFVYQPEQDMGIYRSPLVYLSGTQLRTGRHVATADLLMDSVNNRPVLGILGMDCLRNYCMELDYKRRKIRLSRPGDRSMKRSGTALPLIIARYHHPIIKDGAVLVADTSLLGEPDVRFWIDTGLHGNVDFLLASNRFQKLLRERPFGSVGTFTGPRDLPAAIFPEIELGGTVYRDVAIGAFPEESLGFQGWIGSLFLARHLVTFDFPDRTMYLQGTNSITAP